METQKELNVQKTLLKTQNLSKAYTIKKKWGQRTQFYAVQNLNLTLKKASCLGLVGESGCGKSTLARMLVGLLAPSSGSIIMEGEHLTKPHPQKIQMVFQDPFSSLNPRLSIGRSIAEPLRLSSPNLSNQELRHTTYNALAEVGLTPEKEMYSRFPHEFSGGQRQRIALARALITRPEIVLCDEPVSALDTSVQAHILQLMQDIQKRMGISYIFISHDLHVVAYMSDEIAIMYAGKIVEQASSHDIFQNPMHPYTKALLDAAPSLNTHHREFVGLQGEPPSPFNPPQGCAFHPRCAYAQEICKQQTPEITSLSTQNDHQVACHFPL